MNTKKTFFSPMTIFSLTALLAFVVLTLLTNQFVEISSEVGLMGWLRDTMVYVVGYKFGYKLIASLAIGAIAFAVSRMIHYNCMRTEKRKERATRLNFGDADVQVTKTA